MKVEELRKKSNEELEKLLTEYKFILASNYMKLSVNKKAPPDKKRKVIPIKDLKKDVARIKTVLNERRWS